MTADKNRELLDAVLAWQQAPCSMNVQTIEEQRLKAVDVGAVRRANGRLIIRSTRHKARDVFTWTIVDGDGNALVQSVRLVDTAAEAKRDAGLVRDILIRELS